MITQMIFACIMINDRQTGYSCRGVATGWGQGSDCLSGQIERIENALLIITRLQLMLESLNGMIFQRHYPYHTVAPGWSYPLALGAHTPGCGHRVGPGLKIFIWSSHNSHTLIYLELKSNLDLFA